MYVGDFIRIYVKTIELPRQPINWTPSVTWDQQGWWRKSLLFHPPGSEWAPLVAQMVKHLPAMQETRFGSLGWDHALEKEIGTHSSTLAWKIPWMEEPGRLQSMGLQGVRHYWATSLSLFWMQPWTSQSPRLTAAWLSLSHTFRNVWQKSDSWKVVNMPSGSKVKCHAKDLGLIAGSGRSRGEGNGYPHSCSGLENSVDRGAWWATVHGVAKSQTRLSD